MVAGPSAHFVPILSSSSQLENGETGGYEKPRFSRGGPVMRIRKRSFLSKLIGWPAIIIFGQLVLQFWTWAFLASIQTRGFISLPYSAAEWIQANGHLVTAVFTLLSTALAACSSLLFSWAVRQSISLQLHGEGMSLAAFASSIQLSSRSLIFDHKRRKWSVVSIALIILTGLQTSGWSGLMTPQVVEINTPVTGRELDLSAPILSQMLSQGVLDYCVGNSSKLDAFNVGQTESGYAAARPDHAVLTLMDQSFIDTTAGILPLSFDYVNASSWFPDVTIIPATLSSAVDFSNTNILSSNYSMTQQGFTAAVACEFQNLTASTSPSVNLATDTVQSWTSGAQHGNVTFSALSSNCSVSRPDLSQINSTTGYTVGTEDYVLMLACGSVAENYTLIFVGSVVYDFIQTTVCTFSPQITQVVAEYSDGDLLAGTINAVPLDEGGVPDPSGSAGLNAVITVSNMVFVAQAVLSNTMGDELKSILEDMDLFDNDTILETMEDYISGVAEYSGSVFRACLSAKNGTFVDGVPENITVPTHGTLTIQIVGWHVSLTTVFLLIPGTTVALISIYIVLVAIGRHAVDPDGELFDPADAMHLVSASAAGDLNNVFTGDEAHITAAQSVSIVLETIIGRGLALKVRSFTV